MSSDSTPEHPPRRGSFADGESDPQAHPEDEEVGDFAEGEELPDSAEEHHHGRFSEGQEVLGEEDPEKHVEGRFSTGEDDEPPLPVE